MTSEPVLLRRRSRLRVGLERLSLALIGYGVAGLLAALLGIGALVWTGAAVGSVGSRVETESVLLGGTFRETARALDDAAATAGSFERTLEETPPGVRQAAATVRNLRPRLVALQTQASSIDILGNRPLEGLGQLFGQMAVDLEGLDDQLDVIADELAGNSAALGTNARSLARLADEVDSFAERLEGGLVTDGLAEVAAVIGVVLVIVILGLAVPALGALLLGLWLRRQLAVGRIARPEIVVER